jgi:hypothetical protein
MTSIWRRRNFWMFVLFPVVGFSLILVGGYWHEAVAWLVFLWVVLVHHMTARMRCPRCSRPVGERRYRFLGIDFSWDSPITSKKCTHCGIPLDVGFQKVGTPGA